jgi:hypothetical protein
MQRWRATTTYSHRPFLYERITQYHIKLPSLLPISNPEKKPDRSINSRLLGVLSWELYNIIANMGLKPYLGLQGNALLRAAVMLVVCPTFTCYGYNMSVAGGLLTLSAFNTQFPRMDTINTTGAQQEENSQIQGEFIPSMMHYQRLQSPIDASF